MMDWERMKQDNRETVAYGPINDFCVAAPDARHEGD
jgi:hypothetical protein